MFLFTCRRALPISYVTAEGELRGEKERSRKKRNIRQSECDGLRSEGGDPTIPEIGGAGDELKRRMSILYGTTARGCKNMERRGECIIASTRHCVEKSFASFRRK